MSTPPDAVSSEVSATPHSRAIFWCVIAVLSTATGGVWLGTVEHANYKAGGLLQKLNQRDQGAVDDLPEKWWEPRYTREQIAAEEGAKLIAQHLENNPDADPGDQPSEAAVEERVNTRWAVESARGHVRLMSRGFGTLVYPLALAGILAGLLTIWEFKRRPATTAASSAKPAEPVKATIANSATCPRCVWITCALCILACVALLARATWLNILPHAWGG